MHLSDGIEIIALEGLPEVEAGADLAALIRGALAAGEFTLMSHDVLVVAQKIVSKCEGRSVDLRTVSPGSEALRLAELTGKDARLVEVILSQSLAIVRAARGVLIVRHRLGFVMANAGVDQSNVPGAQDAGRALLLPLDPDASAQALRTELMSGAAGPLGIIISDSFGRPWRLGVTNVALGVAGLPAVIDRRGEPDREGRTLQMTEVALADAVAAAAGLAMGEADEGTPVVLVRGLKWQAPASTGRALLRPMTEDLFR